MRVFTQLMMRKKIPSIYKVLDWIQNTGTQFITTNIIPTSITRVVAKIEVTTTTQDLEVFGCLNTSADTSTNYKYYHLSVYNNKWYIGTNGSEIITGTYNNVVGTVYDIDFNNNNSVIINGSAIATDLSFNGNGYLTIGLRRGYSASRYGRFRYRSFKVYEGTSLIGNFIPVRRLTDNEVGMYDTVTKEFKPNAGTGSFIGSDEIPLTVVGSPTITDGVVSGFSSSNYLSFPSAFNPSDSWEFVIKITTGSSLIQNVKYVLGNFNSERSIVVGTTDKPIQTFKAFISTNGGVSFNIQLISTVEAQTNTDYYLRVGFTGNKYYLDFSTDGINYVGRAEISSTSKISPYILYFGRVFSNGNLWNGSIDLNNSYLIQDGTKYIFTV